jgi:phosphatidylethanolamine/phosphatidyl-N-methylethanolamine N-methyltransferase
MRQNIQKVVDFYYSNYYEAVHSPLHSYSKLSFHAQLESAHSSLIKYPIVLELGAGNSNHIKFVKHRFDTYLLSDVRKIKNDEIPEARSGVIPNRPGIYKSIIDAKILPYPNESVDRIVSGCLLLHIEDPLNALEEWLRVLKAGGVIDTFIPNDQSLLVRLYRTWIL